MKYTLHAIDQYIERWRPGATHAQALAELRQQEASARPLRERTTAGDKVLQSAGGVRFVVKDEPRGRTCVTVLPKTGEETEAVPEAPPRDEMAEVLRPIENYLIKQSRKGDKDATRLLGRLRNALEEEESRAGDLAQGKATG